MLAISHWSWYAKPQKWPEYICLALAPSLHQEGCHLTKHSFRHIRECALFFSFFFYIWCCINRCKLGTTPPPPGSPRKRNWLHVVYIYIHSADLRYFACWRLLFKHLSPLLGRLCWRAKRDESHHATVCLSLPLWWKRRELKAHIYSPHSLSLSIGAL